MTIPLLKRFITKATPDERARDRRIVKTVPIPQARARRDVPIPTDGKDRAVDDRVIRVVGGCATADFGCVLYKRIASERFDFFNIAAARRAVALINIRRRGFARRVRRGIGANIYFCGRERYTVNPLVNVAPQILDTAVFHCVLAVGVAFFRPRRGFYAVRSSRSNSRRIAVCVTVHYRLRVCRFHFNEPQFFDNKVDQEVVLLITRAVCFATRTEIIASNIDKHRCARFRVHARRRPAPFVFTDEDVIKFVSRAVNKQR